jgi:glycosyltransferase involved in cell wall biosynthesis
MACGKPVVATRVGGIPEVVVDGETGILVAPRDHEGMARAIATLLENEPLRRRMGAAGLARARARFSSERMVLDTVRVYQRVAMHPHHEDPPD